PRALRRRGRRTGRRRALPAAAGPARATELRRGNDPAHANLLKLMANMLSATALETLGETMAMIRKRGLDPGRFLEMLTSTMFGGRVHRIYGQRIVARDYVAGFALPFAPKGVRLGLAGGESTAAAVAVGGGVGEPKENGNDR